MALTLLVSLLNASQPTLRPDYRFGQCQWGVGNLRGAGHPGKGHVERSRRTGVHLIVCTPGHLCLFVHAWEGASATPTPGRGAAGSYERRGDCGEDRLPVSREGRPTLGGLRNSLLEGVMMRRNPSRWADGRGQLSGSSRVRKTWAPGMGLWGLETGHYF